MRKQHSIAVSFVTIGLSFASYKLTAADGIVPGRLELWEIVHDGCIAG